MYADAPNNMIKKLWAPGTLFSPFQPLPCPGQRCRWTRSLHFEGKGGTSHWRPQRVTRLPWRIDAGNGWKAGEDRGCWWLVGMELVEAGQLLLWTGTRWLLEQYTVTMRLVFYSSLLNGRVGLCTIAICHQPRGNDVQGRCLCLNIQWCFGL